MKAEIIKDKLHLFPDSPTEQYAADMLLEYKGWESLRSIMVLPNLDTPPRRTPPEEDALLDEIFGKIESPVPQFSPPLPKLDDEDDIPY